MKTHQERERDREIEQKVQNRQVYTHKKRDRRRRARKTNIFLFVSQIFTEAKTDPENGRSRQEKLRRSLTLTM